MIEELNGISIPTQGEITDAQYEKIKEETGFDVQEWKEVVALQNTLNEKVDVNWINAGFNWNHAMLLEAAELLDSIDWKWWKHGKTDWANLEIEMVDEFHFLISRSIETKQTDLITSLVVGKEVASKSAPVVELNEELAAKIQGIITKNFLPAILIDNTIGAVIAWLEAWYLMGYNINDLFKKYKMKYTLNQFRQDNGYKDGSYKKIWFGEEDNVHAQKLIETIETGPEFIDTLYTALTELYKTIPDEAEKSLENFIKADAKWSQFMTLVPEENRKIMFDLAKEFQDYLEK